MATPIPIFVSEMVFRPIPVQNSLTAGHPESLTVTGGAAVPMPYGRSFFLVSNRTSAGNGQSFLRALANLLTESLAGTAWTLRFAWVGGKLKLQISHDNPSSRTITFSGSTTYPNPATARGLGFASDVIVVPASTTVTADYTSWWLWSPDMPISTTGPELFDPAYQYGVPSSLGASQRSPDMTGAYVTNGTQWAAEYMFNGVQYYFKIRPQPGHVNEDLETFWRRSTSSDIQLPVSSGGYGVTAGRVLMWRDRENIVGSDAPSAGSASPFNYVEYACAEGMRSKIPAVPMVPNNLQFWDVRFDLWITERGEAVRDA